MRSFHFLVLIHYSLTFSIFFIKEEPQNVESISGSSEHVVSEASSSGESGSGYLESMTSEVDKYPTELVVRDPLFKCEHGYTGEFQF